MIHNKIVRLRRTSRFRYEILMVTAASLIAFGSSALGQPTQAQPSASNTSQTHADSSAWFGLILPEPETVPAKNELMNPSKVDLPALPASFGPGPRDPSLDGSRIYSDVQKIVGFSLESKAAGEFLWGRVTGRPAYYKTALWVKDALTQAGATDAHLEEFTPPEFNIPTSGEIRLIASADFGADSKDVILQSAMVGGAGPVNGSVTAPLIYLGQGTDADLIGRDLKGKIAVISSFPVPSIRSAMPEGGLKRMIANGAVGAIEILAQPGNVKSFDRDRHGCGTGLCFTIGGKDGWFLLNALGAAGKAEHTVTARLQASSETLKDARIPNVVATIPGRTDRTVIINAHMDGWFTGADDNASGLATMLALARYFAKQPKLERTLVFVGSAGHHSSGVMGAAEFRKVHDNDYVARADLVLNLEHVAVSSAIQSIGEQESDNFVRKLMTATVDHPKQVGVKNRAPFLMDIWRQGVTCFGLSLQRIVDPRVPGDIGPFAQLPMAQTGMVSAGTFYHTSGESPELIPQEGLERAARFHAFLIKEAATAPANLLNGGSWTPRSKCPATP